VNEAAKLKGCSRQTIHYAIAKGKLDYKEEKSVVYKVSLASLAKLEINVRMQHARRPRRSEGK
jgi:hypothetical protein